MEILTGTLPIPALPQRLLANTDGELIVEHVQGEDAITLRDMNRSLSLDLADVIRDIVWCYNVNLRVLVLGSEYGKHCYVVDASVLRILCDVTIRRDTERYWNRFGLLVTPDETHIVLMSDMLVHVLSWDGALVYVRRIETTDTFVSLSDHAITLNDEANGGIQFALPFIKGS